MVEELKTYSFLKPHGVSDFPLVKMQAPHCKSLIVMRVETPSFLAKGTGLGLPAVRPSIASNPKNKVKTVGLLVSR
jgi:hypothetical protein